VGEASRLVGLAVAVGLGYGGFKLQRWWH